MLNNFPDHGKNIQLLRSSSTGFFNKGVTKQKLSVLDYYASHGVATDLWLLSECLEDKDAPVRDKAAGVVIGIFRKLKSHEELTTGLKSVQLSTSGLDRFRNNFSADTYFQLLAIASFNHSGYVREHAVVLLAKSGQAGAIRYLLLRTADWVNEVRLSAVREIHHYLQPAWRDQWLQELPLVDWLLKVKRVNLHELHESIINFLVAEPLEPTALKLLTGNERSRRLLFKYRLKRDGLTPYLLEVISRDKNFIIRLLLIPYLADLQAEEQASIFRKLLGDKSARVRLTALYACKPQLESLWEYAEALLYDPSASVRDLARRYAVNKGINIVAICRHRLQSFPVSYGALMQLGESGSREDIPIFEKHIVSPAADIKSACLAGIYRLDEQLASGYAISMLGSSSRHIRSRCLAILSKGCDAAALEKIRTLYAHGGPAQRKTALFAFGAMGGWKIIGDIVYALCDPDMAIRHLAWQYLRTWYFKSFEIFTTPGVEDLARAKQAYLKAGSLSLSMDQEQLSLWEQVKGLII